MDEVQFTFSSQTTFKNITRVIEQQWSALTGQSQKPQDKGRAEGERE
jgi:hypothetical protein